MDKTTQDLAWSILPKEFKEEVKRIGNILNKDASVMFGTIGQLSHKHLDLFVKLFGIHNLTSDAEEEEMLTVPRKAIIQAYEKSCAKRATKYDVGYADCLYNLFGSKCLPDERQSAKSAHCPEPQPAEPKYHIGQRVRHIPTRLVDVIDGISQSAPYIYHFKHMVDPINGQGIFESDLEPYIEPKYHQGEKVRYNGYVYEVEGLVGKNRYALKGLNFDLDEDMIEPYSEPRKNDSEILHAESVKESRIADEETHLRNLLQETANCDKEFDTILKDSFREHNRLHIAAMMMQGLLANPNNNANLRTTVADALNCADALIAEAEKGGKA